MTNIIKNNDELEKSLENMEICKGREKIMAHNNGCIIGTIAFYEYILLNDIVKPFLFSENYDKCLKIGDLVRDRLSFNDRFKIICEISKIYNIQKFKKFYDYKKMRNDVAHNLFAVIDIDTQTKESRIFFAGEEITWSNYQDKLKEWAGLSRSMANFVLNVFKSVNENGKIARFPYCELVGKCVLVQHALLLPEPDEDYTAFFGTGFNMDLLDYLNKEQELVKSRLKKKPSR